MFEHYLKTAWRNLRRNRLYALINVLGISLGLAAFWLVALYVGDEVRYDRDNPNADRIFRLAQHASWDGGKLDIVPTSPPFAPELKARFPEVEEAVRLDIEGGGVVNYLGNSFKQGDVCFTDPGFFRVFGLSFLQGNAETALTEPASVVLTESLAAKIFGDAAKALNETVYFDKEPARVTGVVRDMPANSHMRFSGFRPFSATPDDNWQNFYVYTYLLLKRGADAAAFEKKLPAFAAATVQKEMGVKDYRLELQPLTAIHLHSHLDYEIGANGSSSRLFLFGTVGLLILLIALINYMNLSTARSVTRVKEVGIRKVVGSARRSLVGLFLSEALLLTMAAAVLACVLVQLSMPFFNQLSGKQLTAWRFGVLPTAGLVVLIALLSGLVAGSYPAFVLARFHTIPSLKGQLGNLQTSIFFRRSLVVFQFVVAVCLISGSYVIYRQLQYVQQKDLGFDKAQLLTFHLDDRNVRNKIGALKQALLKSPLIQSVAVAGNPIGNNDIGGHDFNFEQNGSLDTKAQMAKQLLIDDDFLATAGIKLLEGRNFLKEMPTDTNGAVLINETLLRQLGYRSAIGKKMQYRVVPGAPLNVRTIIGVVRDFHLYSLQHKIEPLVMLLPPIAREQDNLYVRLSAGNPTKALAYLTQTFRRFDEVNAPEIHFLDENFSRQYAAEQKQEQLSFAFTLLAFFIACMGLTGLVIFTTVQRTKEIGIRKVLGASVLSVTALLGKDLMKLVTLATFIAIPIAWWGMNKWLEDFAYRIEIQWWMFLVSGALAIFIALLIVCLQAVKAATTNPVKSLRTE